MSDTQTSDQEQHSRIERIGQLIDDVSINYSEMAEGHACLPGRAIDSFSFEDLQTQCPQINLKFYKFKDIKQIYEEHFKQFCREDLAIRNGEDPFDEEYESHMYKLFEKYIPINDTSDMNDLKKKYLNDLYICRLQKQDKIVHVFQISRLIQADDQGQLLFNNDGCWWNKYYVGQQSYKGGFFTYQTNYGGPLFGFDLVFNIEEPIPLFFIPPFYADKYSDDENYTKNFAGVKINDQVLHKYIERGFSGSHLFEGLEDINRRPYSSLVRQNEEQYSDKIGVHFSNLGFTGFTTCDECEIFLSHETMIKYNLKQPVSFNLNEEKLNIETNGLLEDPEKRNRIERYILENCFGKTNDLEITPIVSREFREQTFNWVNINVILNGQ